MNFLQVLLLFISQTLLLNAFNIDDFGAIANDYSYDASIINGKAFRSALLAANNGSDRTVLIEYGKVYNMLPAGNVQNLVNVTIQLDGNITSHINDTKQWPVSGDGIGLDLISISYCQGLVIQGSGTVNGYGFVWWWYIYFTGIDNRPNLLAMDHCNNTLIQDITLQDSPQFHAYLMSMINLTVQNVVVYVDVKDDEYQIPTFPLNTDGIDVSGKDIYLRNLTIQNYDDAVAVKPLHFDPNEYLNCTENVLVEDCYVKYGVGMSIGSVPPDPGNNCIRDVTVRNVKFDKPFKAIYIKPNPGDSGTGYIGNILYENIEINEALWWAIFIATQQEHQPYQNGTDCSFFLSIKGHRVYC